MFLGNIAFSLEFIVLGVGAFLIGWARFKCAKQKLICDTQTTVNPSIANPAGVSRTEVNKDCSKRPCGTGFVHAVGVILIILALINIVDTFVNAVQYKHSRAEFKQKIEMWKDNHTNSNTNDTNSNPTTNPNTTPTPANE